MARQSSRAREFDISSLFAEETTHHDIERIVRYRNSVSVSVSRYQVYRFMAFMAGADTAMIPLPILSHHLDI